MRPEMVGARSTPVRVSAAFHVAIHDVEPRQMGAIDAILDALTPLVGPRFSMAVVPCWHGQPLTAADTRLVTAARAAGEVVLHGWSHRRERSVGLVSLVTGRSDEFAALGAEEAVARLARGRALLERIVDRPVRGFLAPSFRLGPVDLDLAARADLSFVVGWRRLQRKGAAPLPLATVFWDLSPLGVLGWLGELGGRAARLRRSALPVVAVHPADVDRGFLRRAVGTVRALLDAGREPVLLGQLAGEGGPA